MKRFMIIAAALSVALTAPGENKPQLKDLKDKVSYSIGLDLGFNFKKQKLELNPDALLAGVKDAQSGKQPLLNENEVKETMTALTKQIEDKQKAVAEQNVKDGEKFLAENKKKEGVKTTASGLQYKVVKEGTGPQPKLTDSVVANYRGTLINGTEFDSSYKRGQPATFPLKGVIKGWTEALQLMKVGSKYQLFIPANLAYGDRGMGPDLGPNSTLIFEVELVGIQPLESPSPSPSLNPSRKAAGVSASSGGSVARTGFGRPYEPCRQSTRSREDSMQLASETAVHLNSLPRFPIRPPARPPTNLQGCRRLACRDEKCGQPLGGNRVPSIDWREIRQRLPAAANSLLATESQFHFRLL